MMRNIVACALCAVLACGCQSLGLQNPFAAPAAEPALEGAGSPSKAWNSSPVLYTREGTPVGAATPSGPSPHEISGGESGRTYILELYQDAVEARDSLELEVAALQKELAQGQDTLLFAQEEVRVAKERAAQLEQEREELLQRNIMLAGRLTHAQVQRLEAEKLLLETRLQEIAALEPGEQQP